MHERFRIRSTPLGCGRALGTAGQQRNRTRPFFFLRIVAQQWGGEGGGKTNAPPPFAFRLSFSSVSARGLLCMDTASCRYRKRVYLVVGRAERAMARLANGRTPARARERESTKLAGRSQSKRGNGRLLYHGMPWPAMPISAWPEPTDSPFWMWLRVSAPRLRLVCACPPPSAALARVAGYEAVRVYMCVCTCGMLARSHPWRSLYLM
ncbi:hypothetical protein BS50DRAFT_207234 [Corynespora cassiicola Philippines]|uniref:Uncharacterized protein n=1 Tax=Corynespora cassiicola Philippines TaxID=1448308 RepID=A0A2T2N4H3_CORCC|nr:hypothetical protein BS50DRAFT_207234 [Corynespora cassiicola Philippines]